MSPERRLEISQGSTVSSCDRTPATLTGNPSASPAAPGSPTVQRTVRTGMPSAGPEESDASSPPPGPGCIRHLQVAASGTSRLQ